MRAAGRRRRDDPGYGFRHRGILREKAIHAHHKIIHDVGRDRGELVLRGQPNDREEYLHKLILDKYLHTGEVVSKVVKVDCGYRGVHKKMV